jgi:hypothetical protein
LKCIINFIFDWRVKLKRKINSTKVPKKIKRIRIKIEIKNKTKTNFWLNGKIKKKN